MPLTSLRPWIFTAIVASVAAMVSGIQSGLPLMSWLAAALFAIALVAVAIDINRPWWVLDVNQIAIDDAATAAMRNARLLAFCYMWGSLSLMVIYRMTSLRWQHGLQYAIGMAVIAWLIMNYVFLVMRPASFLRSQRAQSMAMWLALLHGAAALAGIVFLLVSGKIFSTKGDWAANQIFLTGGLAITALSVISAYTQFKLCQPRQDDAEPAAGQ